MELPFTLATLLDLILLGMVLEGAALIVWRRRTGKGPRVGATVRVLLAGGLVLIAWRAHLAGAPLPGVALILGLGGLAHLLDIKGRWE
ncbi:hypothetical protein [Roseospirillum parvum]|uniref:DUF2568 domain-containing protein n=1 Tax=Roseospirillum parvum TaxID=83401 RepID=A0A1G7WDU0_9PROT|nr:hypothetical protein [Roseospirillum parvum]SDG69949.1 hypothetical protein SAMN05421742_102156 [Roseospirillum parvum]